MLSVTSKDDDHADAAGDGCLATKRTMVEGMTLPTAMMVMVTVMMIMMTMPSEAKTSMTLIGCVRVRPRI